jgi:hypothetical protein
LSGSFDRFGLLLGATFRDVLDRTLWDMRTFSAHTLRATRISLLAFTGFRKLPTSTPLATAWGSSQNAPGINWQVFGLPLVYLNGFRLRPDHIVLYMRKPNHLDGSGSLHKCDRKGGRCGKALGSSLDGEPVWQHKGASLTANPIDPAQGSACYYGLNQYREQTKQWPGSEVCQTARCGHSGG